MHKYVNVLPAVQDTHDSLLADRQNPFETSLHSDRFASFTVRCSGVLIIAMRPNLASKDFICVSSRVTLEIRVRNSEIQSSRNALV